MKYFVSYIANHEDDPWISFLCRITEMGIIEEYRIKDKTWKPSMRSSVLEKSALYNAFEELLEAEGYRYKHLVDLFV